VKRVYLAGLDELPTQKIQEPILADLSSREGTEILEVKEIDTFYGLSHILFKLSLEIHEGEVVCILGRNGVGKTTTLRSIVGLTPPKSGSIKFSGDEIKGRQPFHVARLGIGFVPEDRIIFPDLSVRDNLEIVIKRGMEGRTWTLDEIYEIFPILKERETQEKGDTEWRGTTDAYNRKDPNGESTTLASKRAI
jgi:ABC-type branched-subunit amino acid transport system ATPase component